MRSSYAAGCKTFEQTAYSGIERRKKALIRAYEREKNKYIEDTLLTYAEFSRFYREWLKKEENCIHRYNDHEIFVGTENISISEDCCTCVFPRWRDSIEQKQLQSGDFIDSIYSCPFELHELVSDKNVSDILKKLKPEYKEIIYYEIVRGYSNREVAIIMKQSERNISKKLHRVFDKIRRELYLCLSVKPEINARERAFMTRYEEKLNED